MGYVEHVLLIDDDEDDRFLFSQALNEVDKKIVCTCVSNAEEGLRLLKKGSGQLPDVIFLDLNMPRIGGKQCLQEIKKIQKAEAVPVIIYSTTKSALEEQETKKLGAASFMVKPNNFDTLKQELKTAISQVSAPVRTSFKKSSAHPAK